ncbi:hypothetical protein KGM_209923B, partial [Danaus plexippus plexippus]
ILLLSSYETALRRYGPDAGVIVSTSTGNLHQNPSFELFSKECRIRGDQCGLAG